MASVNGRITVKCVGHTDTFSNATFNLCDGGVLMVSKKNRTTTDITVYASGRWVRVTAEGMKYNA
jgi:uncharacterized Fe-S cluster-containing protein